MRGVVISLFALCVVVGSQVPISALLKQPFLNQKHTLRNNNDIWSNSGDSRISLFASF